ncbi:acyl-ACP--UDP-N-acetylglucosamine O-acyltransferase [Luteibaculum oceani]|uniref:Acyl-ACP--UDP-N-acetylglucosamine O-acyltransferase n=1 Tax=Luteibaculum oceani TaxID=1294296 RepID=A0A5C6V4H3_9FLAO|nr:acyl-ACP--UDP-N-acetylglucosamine O-acyltransferase [Luteibaculum oceani]TXC78365.1 acyl-ACP--UDP-N-acetylglucosamine O-acyltransferase [Luteibaculum oceani]
MSAVANIHPDAKVGKGTVVEPFATIYGDVVIGENCWIGPGAVIMDGARIGNNCRIFPGAVISAIPQDLKYKGEYTTVEIGDNCQIRECVTINKGTTDRDKTVVGNNCLLMAYVHLAHDCLVGNNVIIANSVNVAGHVTIEDHVIVEGSAAIQQFLTLGAHCFIGGGSLVRKNVPPYVKAAREPLSYIGVNSIGLKRRGFEDKEILEIEDIYRLIYVHNNNISKALKIAELEIPASQHKEIILSFINNSEKGIIRGIS